MSHEFQPAKVSIGIHRNKKVFFIRHPQRDEIRGEFETDPIFSKLIDFACRALLGAFWSSSILASAWFEAAKRCQITRSLAQKGVDDRVVCHLFGVGNRSRSHQMLSKARREF